MQLWQAALIGLFAYLGRNQVPWLFGTTGGWYGIGRPLVAGTIIGYILGDVKTGVLCGIAVQAIFIGQITPGGAMPSDLNLASFVGIPLAIVAGGSPETVASAYKAIDPSNHITENTPPTLVVTGRNDHLVPVGWGFAQVQLARVAADFVAFRTCAPTWR